MGCRRVIQQGDRNKVLFMGRALESHSKPLTLVTAQSPPKDPRKPLDAEKFTQNEAQCREDDLKSKTGFMCRPLAHDLKNQETIPPFPCPCPAKSASGATGWGSSLVSRPRDGLPSKELPTTGGVAPRPVGSGGCSERRRQSLGMAGSEVEGARSHRAPRQLTDH